MVMEMYQRPACVDVLCMLLCLLALPCVWLSVFVALLAMPTSCFLFCLCLLLTVSFLWFHFCWQHLLAMLCSLLLEVLGANPDYQSSPPPVIIARTKGSAHCV